MVNLTPMVRNLLLINVAMLLLEGVGAFGAIPRLLALYPWTSDYFQPFQHVSYMFLHAGWRHLFSNMLGLFFFGPTLEMHWGAPRFLTFWMICGIGAGVLYSGVRQYELAQMRDARNAFVESPTGIGFSDFFRDFYPGANGYELVARDIDRNPDNRRNIEGAIESVNTIYERATNGPMVGASGALFGVLFAFAYLFPNRELQLLLLPVPIKAKYFVTLYALYELYAGVQRAPGDNVAHFAHLGGMLIGFLLLKYWERHSSRFY